MLEILDSVIATAAVVLGLSLIVQAVQQFIKQLFDLKSRYMKKEVAAMLSGSKTSRNALVQSFVPFSGEPAEKESETNEIISQLEEKLRSFGFKDMELLETVDVEKFKKIVEDLPMFIGKESKKALDVVKEEIETWFDVSMKAFQEHYERRMKVWAFGLGLALVVGLNANVIGVYRDFSTNKVVRDSAINWGQRLTEEQMKQEDPEERQATMQKTIGEIHNIVDNNSYQLYRWKKAPGEGYLEIIFGCLGMALLVSLGAPFWYDTLKSLMGLKNLLSGKRKKSEEEE